MHFEMIGVIAQGLQHAICQNTFDSTKTTSNNRDVVIKEILFKNTLLRQLNIFRGISVREVIT